jgi:RimJ/RimL family protein N-acetyltransferase
MADITISLVPFTMDHVARTFTWVTNPYFQRSFLMRGQPTWEVHKAHFDQALKDPSQDIFAVIYGDTHCGNCGLKNIAFGKEAELWIYIGEPSLRGKGLGHGATRLLIEKAFEAFDLKLVYVHFGDFNVAARQLYERIGFRQVPLKEGASEQWLDRQCEIIRMELVKS